LIADRQYIAVIMNALAWGLGEEVQVTFVNVGGARVGWGVEPILQLLLGEFMGQDIASKNE
jgi:hypothetical protein